MQPEGEAGAVEGSPVVPSSRLNTKIVLVVVSVVADFLMSGITYGYSGVVQVLTIDSKAFASSCAPGETLPCSAQIRALSAAFTLSVSTVSASGVPVGLLLDAVGPRHTTILGSLVFAAGLVSFAVAPSFSDQLYFAGFFFLSLGGPAIITATMNFADLYPGVASAIISAQNGAFDASSAVMFLMGKAVTTFGVSLGVVMLSYLSVPLLLIIIAALLFPDLPFGLHSQDAPPPPPPGDTEEQTTEAPTASPEQTGELWRLYRLRLQQSETASPPNPAEQDASTSAGSDPTSASASESTGNALKEPLLLKSGEESSMGGEERQLLKPPPDIYNTDIYLQLKSTVFWVLVLVSSYLVTRSNFYIASINQQMKYAILKHSGPSPDPVAVEESVKFYVDLFNYIMPLGGALSVPISGVTMVRLGLTSTFALIGAMCCIVTSLQLLSGIIPLEAQIAGFIVFSVLRAFIFGAIAAFMGAIFGFRNFGRLFGVSRVAGAIITIVQYPLIHLAEHGFHGDYRPIDLGFLVAEILLVTAFPLYLWKGVFYGYFFIPPKSTLHQVDS